MYRTVLYKFALGLTCLAFVFSCGEKKQESEVVVDTIPPGATEMVTLPLPADSAIIDSGLKIGGRDIGVETNLWYNLMPGPDDNQPPQLNLQVRLMTEEKTTLPSGVSADYAWVTIGGGTWGIAASDDPIGSGAVIERMFRGGPIYDEDLDSPPTASVIVRVVDKDGNEYFVRNNNQAIEKVY